jgi:hypothetical protein
LVGLKRVFEEEEEELNIIVICYAYRIEKVKSR